MGRTVGLITITAYLLTACASEPASSPTRSASVALALPTATQESFQIQEPRSAICIDEARFVEDLTIPDGHRAAPGEVLEKRWAVLNSGTCDWGAGYRLIRIDDGSIVAAGELALYPARAGETGVWSVQLVAPDQIGDQMASWQAQAPDGSFFGDQVFVLIEVISNP